MREIGILYTPDNIRAIAEKRKWQTRRVCMDQTAKKYVYLENCETYPSTCGEKYTGWAKDCGFPYLLPTKPRYRVGDILYVKEAIRVLSLVEKHCDGTTTFDIGYKDGSCQRVRAVEPSDKPAGQWYSPMFMPKWAARPELKRRVTEVRVQRVQDISEEDAIAEGIDTEGRCLCPPDKAVGVRYCIRCNKRLHDFIGEFAELWDSINKKKYPWSSNPWVWVIGFEKCGKPVENDWPRFGITVPFIKE